MFRGLPLWSFFLAALFVLSGNSPARADDEGHSGKYQVDYFDETGHETDAVFDFTKPADAEKFEALLRDGKVIRAKLEHIPKITEMFSLRWDLGLWTLIVFGLLLYILSKTAWPAMLKGLKQREQNIVDAATAAEKARNEAEGIREQLRGEMARANDTIRGMMDEARKDATTAKDEMLNAAKTEIATERDRLRRDIETARDQALMDIYNQSTQLAALISAKTLGREVRPDDHKRLFDESLAEFKSAAKTSGVAGSVS
jgi:F-type H+-transporting ATPase subunit b